MANEEHARSSLKASVEVGASFLIAGTTEIARLETRVERLRQAFIRHRTATHEAAPTFCKTCRESDAVLYG